jgi:bifunctional non-homologous end joining protein LigD
MAVTAPAPQLATLVDRAPEGDGWLHELKLDGYRLVAEIRGARVALYSRGGLDWAQKVPTLAKTLAKLGEDAVLDGELIVLDERGVSSFGALQQALASGDDRACVFYAFDLLALGKASLVERPLVERKAALAELLAKHARTLGKRVRLSEHVIGRGGELFAHACQLGAEGIISKRRDGRYRAGRSTEWLKVKCKLRQELVIGGFSAPRASRSGFGALLVGRHDDDGKLRYAGKVGTGFSSASLREVHDRLLPLAQREPPFVDPPRGAEARGVTWLRPVQLAEIEYAELTRDGKVRHASFQGLRDDKPAVQIPIERARNTDDTLRKGMPRRARIGVSSRPERRTRKNT